MPEPAAKTSGSPQCTADLANGPKPSNDRGVPVLLFDKASVDFASTIELLTTAEVAEILRISISGVRRLQQARHLPFIKVGGSVRFSKSDIASYVKKQRVEPIG